MHRSRPVALAATALIAAGCGAGTDSAQDLPAGPQREVAAAIERLEELAQAGDARTICADLLAPSLAQQLRAADVDCVRALDDALDDVDDASLEVRSVTVTGTTAVAQVVSTEAGEERVSPFRLERQGNDWKLASLG